MICFEDEKNCECERELKAKKETETGNENLPVHPDVCKQSLNIQPSS
jgi:hypothetical protein